jgi:hypothetical protein
MMRGMERRGVSYRVSSADEAIHVDRKGCALSRLVFCLLASNHGDDEDFRVAQWLMAKW